MSFRLHMSTAATVRIPLACDPAIIEANTAEAVAAYKASHDPSLITVPSDAFLFTIRPLTAAERVNAACGAGSKGQPLVGYAAIALPAAVEKVEQRRAVVEGDDPDPKAPKWEQFTISAFLDSMSDDIQLIEVMAELVDLVRSISGLDSLGKSPSERRHG